MNTSLAFPEGLSRYINLRTDAKVLEVDSRTCYEQTCLKSTSHPLLSRKLRNEYEEVVTYSHLGDICLIKANLCSGTLYLKVGRCRVPRLKETIQRSIVYYPAV
jgi:hypothetical protein